jgi:hypothetical protein
MDSLRGNLTGDAEGVYDAPGIEPPPMIGDDERRMHVRAYNYWARLLDGRSFPAIESLETDDLGDFGPNSVLLDFTSGIENPAITFVGSSLAHECGLDDSIETIGDVPRGSLLSRLTDHYLQIIANRAPIGFEAEFTNSSGTNILYRGVLLPFSSDDDTIDFILGVINWKAAADTSLSAALADELAAATAVAATPRPTVPVWADGPDAVTGNDSLFAGDHDHHDSIGNVAWPGDEDYEEGADAYASLSSLPAPVRQDPIEDVVEDDAPAEADVTATATDGEDDDALLLVAEFDSEGASLADWLAEARSSADQAAQANARGHAALYRAIADAAGVARAAAAEPEDYAELLSEARITVSDRSPMTAVAKLVFGNDYDKTRLAEVSAVLGYASDRAIAPAQLADHITRYPGGLKGLVKTIRAENRPDRPACDADGEAREMLRQAEAIAHLDLTGLDDTSEFLVVVARRGDDGVYALVGVHGDGDVDAARMLRATAKKHVS